MANSEKEIEANIKIISQKIQETCIKAGRNPDSVKLCAVSKFHPTTSVDAAIKTGQLLFGENRVQEASEKFSSILIQNPQVKLHIIGQLQTNKVKKAVEVADTIQSVDRIELIKEIEKQCSKINKNINILLEVHTGEESKSGFKNFEELSEAIKYIVEGNAPHVIPKGFMTMAPFTDDKDLIRKSFKTLKKLSEEISDIYKDSGFSFTELSMGMSGDFEIAIEEGSTMVRVGTAIFGEREY